MLSAYLAAASQLFDPGVRASLWRALFVALAAEAALWTGASAAMPWLALSGIPWFDTVAQFLGFAGVFVISWILFPGFVSAGVAFFLEDVADAVERRHYPGLAAARAQGVGEMAATAARFLALFVLVNLALLPFLFVPPVFPFVFYPANGYLLGREYFELVAARRANPPLVRALAARNRLSLWAAGTVAALMLTVPLLNLVAPVIATAAMVHLFHAWDGATGHGGTGRGAKETARENQ
ncbi:MAG: EI24 domain-containing protein [Pseudomonadota bacterium]